MKLLTKQRTKELETSTTPVINVFWDLVYSTLKFKLFGKHKLDKQYGEILAATWKHGLPDSFPKRVTFWADRIGHRPVYYVDYEYRNATWGLEIGGVEVVFYYSKRGECLQVPRDITREQLTIVVGEFHRMIHERL